MKSLRSTSAIVLLALLSEACAAKAPAPKPAPVAASLPARAPASLPGSEPLRLTFKDFFEPRDHGFWISRFNLTFIMSQTIDRETDLLTKLSKANQKITVLEARKELSDKTATDAAVKARNNLILGIGLGILIGGAIVAGAWLGVTLRPIPAQ